VYRFPFLSRARCSVCLAQVPSRCEGHQASARSKHVPPNEMNIHKYVICTYIRLHMVCLSVVRPTHPICTTTAGPRLSRSHGCGRHTRVAYVAELYLIIEDLEYDCEPHDVEAVKSA
jgi:hypothetical protein